MSVNPKHLATLLFGAAAALGAGKYMSMSPEEKQKLADNLKEKAHKFKDEAESGVEKAKGYFDELTTKAADAFKDHFPDAEKYIHDLFNKKEETTNATSNADPSAGNTGTLLTDAKI